MGAVTNVESQLNKVTFNYLSQKVIIIFLGWFEKWIYRNKIDCIPGISIGFLYNNGTARSLIDRNTCQYIPVACVPFCK